MHYLINTAPKYSVIAAFWVLGCVQFLLCVEYQTVPVVCTCVYEGGRNDGELSYTVSFLWFYVALFW